MNASHKTAENITMPQFGEEGWLQKAINYLNLAALSPDERMHYERDIVRCVAIENKIEEEKQEALNKLRAELELEKQAAIENVKAEMEQKKQAAIENLVKKEKAEIANSIAINMLKQGYNFETIASITGLSQEEIRKLKAI